MESSIESGLAEMKTTLDLLASNIEAKKKRKAELKDLVAEDARINKEIGRLKKEHRAAKAKLDWLIEFFKSVNGGQFPDGMYPLFQQQPAPPPQSTIRTVFIGYQEIGNGTRQAMFEVHGLEGYTRETTLLEASLRKRNIPIPDHPTYEAWMKQKGAAA